MSAASIAGYLLKTLEKIRRRDRNSKVWSLLSFHLSFCFVVLEKDMNRSLVHDIQSLLILSREPEKERKRTSQEKLRDQVSFSFIS
jgi:hypothetical protein